MWILLKNSNFLKNKIELIFNKLEFNKFLEPWEQIEFYGSFKYWLMLEWFSDVDIWITSQNPKKTFLNKINFIVDRMLNDKYLKKMYVNNFYDNFDLFDKAKEKLMSINSRFFIIEVVYYLDELLKNNIKFQFHIWKDKYVEEFEQLLNLSEAEKELLLELKKYVYENLPFYWNRSILLYEWFLNNIRTKTWIRNFLQKFWVKK